MIQFTIFCLNNVIIQHGKNYYTETHVIVAGGNHSVSQTNIEVRYIISKIAGVLKITELDERFNNDIICGSLGKQQKELMKCDLQTAFKDFVLALDFKQMLLEAKLNFWTTDPSIFGFTAKTNCFQQMLEWSVPPSSIYL